MLANSGNSAKRSRAGDLMRDGRVEFMQHPEAAGTLRPSKVGFDRDVREVALTGRLEKGASGGMQGADPAYAQGDELGIGKIQITFEPCERGDES